MNRQTGLSIAAGVLLILIALRFVNLSVDPPLYQTGHGQSQLTDPYHLTFAARSAVLYDDWHPFDYHRWDVFKNSLVSGVAYVMFSLGGVSRVTANLAAVLLSTVGLLLFVLALWRDRDRWELVIAGLIVFVNNSLFFYGRMPFLETGLIFLTGLLFFVFVRYHDRLWGQVLTGLLIALAALAGKLFGLLLIGPVLLALVYRYRKSVLVPAAAVICGLVVGGAAYLLLFYGTDFSILTKYLGEQTTGIYGTPPGFSSIPNFFKMLITYGGEAGLWRFSPFFMVLISLSVLLTLLTLPVTGEYKRESLPVVFCLAMVLVGLAGLSPFHYRPMRYAIFLLPAAAVVVAYAVRLTMATNVRLMLQPKWLIAPILLAVWYLVVQLRMWDAIMFQKFRAGAEFVFIGLFIAIVLTALLFLWLQKPRRVPGRRLLLIPMLLLIGGLTVLQLSYLYRGLSQPGTHLEKYNRDLAELVHPAAVLTGPYAPVMTTNNELRGVIYQFGLANKQVHLLTRFPITHVAAEASNWQIALQDFQSLRQALPIASLMLRDQEIGIFRLTDASVPLTDYEKGQLFMVQNRYDSSVFYFERFVQRHPDNLIGATGLVRALAAEGSVNEAVSLAQNLADRQSENYNVQAFCEGFFRRIYQGTRNQNALVLAEKYAERARDLNPHVQLWESRPGQ